MLLTRTISRAASSAFGRSSSWRRSPSIAVDDLGVAATRPSHVITVYGADHPGIVHAVSVALAERGVNITGLETRLAGASDAPLYVMIIEVAMPEGSEPDLEAALSQVADQAEVEVSLRPLGSRRALVSAGGGS